MDKQSHQHLEKLWKYVLSLGLDAKDLAEIPDWLETKIEDKFENERAHKIAASAPLKEQLREAKQYLDKKDYNRADIIYSSCHLRRPDELDITLALCMSLFLSEHNLKWRRAARLLTDLMYRSHDFHIIGHFDGVIEGATNVPLWENIAHTHGRDAVAARIVESRKVPVLSPSQTLFRS